jgi:capsular exopolysaccharide synthesis family protein
MKERHRRITEQIQNYEGHIKQAPAREQALMMLMRDYENQRKNYQSLLDKRLGARVAESLEKRQKGEQFRIIDPANLPEKPEKPDRLRIFLLGLVAGLGLGFGAAFVVEQMNPAFRRPEEAEYLLGIPLLASIPSFSTLMNKPAKGLSFNSNRPMLTGPAGSVQSPPMLFGKEDGEANGNGHGNGHGNGNGNGRSKGNGQGHGFGAAFSRLEGWIPLPQWATSGKNKGGRFMNKTVAMDQLSGELNLVVKWSPLSVVAEQYRVAATRLALMAAERRNTVVVVTSAVTGEGKSSTAANLAYTLARDLGKATLLIDCDVKCPMVHTYMGIKPEPGLAEVLHGTCSVRAALTPMGEWPLWVMPAGNQKRRAVELSKVGQLAAILNDLRPQFDYIIMDAPPILPLADMNVLAGMADILALVVRAENTGRDVVQTALNTLKPSIPAGLILTGLQPNGIPYYMQQPYYLQAEKAHRVTS